MKFCKNKLCEQVNPQEESNFHKYSASKDGLNKYCKSCMKKKVGYINKTDRKNSKHKEYSMWTGKEEKDFKEVYSDMSLKELQKKFNKSESAIKNKARELNISKISYVNKPISIHKISFPDKCGVYAIKNNANNKIYIGSTHNLQQRIEKHIHDLKNNKHGNKDLQKDYNNNNNDFVCWIVYLGEDYKNTEEKIINGYFKYLYNKTRYTTIKKHDFKET